MPYQQIRRLGNGHFGEVILERDEALDRLCAAKYLQPGGPTRFDEAQAMLLGAHDHVVQVYSADDDPNTGMVVIRMEYHPAGSLHDVFQTQPRNVGEIVRRSEDALRGLQHLHSNGILHRDVKPANILVTKTGSAVVSDFGLARKFADAGAFPPIGYAAHLPPEAFAGTGQITTVAGDIFAMGVTLYRLLEGDAFIPTDLQGIQDAVLQGRYPPNDFSPHVHDRLRRVVRKATHRDADSRYESADQFRHALESARPVVAWEADPTDLRAWVGHDAKTGSTYRCVIGANGARYEVKAEKTTGNGRVMRERRFERSRLTLVAATRHAHDVINTYAQSA